MSPFDFSEPYVTEDELKLMLRGAELSGAIEEEEQVTEWECDPFLLFSKVHIIVILEFEQTNFL